MFLPQNLQFFLKKKQKLLIFVAFTRIYVKINDPSVTINRMSISGLMGGGILLLYSLLLYAELPSMAWNPLFPVLIAVVLYLVMYVNVIPEVKTHEEGMHNVVVWMEDIEEKIANVRFVPMVRGVGQGD